MTTFKRKLTAALVLATAIAISEARADASCTQLFAKLREQAARVMNGRQQNVYFTWTTNYFVPDINARFTGVARGQLSGPPVLRGSSETKRVETYYDASLNVLPQKTTPMQLTIDGPRMYLFAFSTGPDARTIGTYGPFDPVCFDNKFAVIHSGDSLEVFTFVGSGPPLNLSTPIN